MLPSSIDKETFDSIVKMYNELKATNSRYVNGIISITKKREDMKSFYDESPETFVERLYLLLEKVDTPTCACGLPCKFFRWGYISTCGNKNCISKKRHQSYVKTMELQGVTSHTQLESFKEKMRSLNMSKTGYAHNFADPECRKKASSTLKDRTGYEYPLQNPESRKKRLETVMEKFGSANFFSAASTKSTMMERWGCENIMHNENKKKEIASNMRNTKLSMLQDKLEKFNIMLIDSKTNWIRAKCNCGNEIHMPNSSFNFFLRNSLSPCEICNPRSVSIKNSSKGEQELFSFLEDVNARNRWYVPGAGEADIFIKGKNIALEYNGVYWHNELHREMNYHLNKTEKMLRQNVKLYHVWEDDWNEKKDIVKSRIQGIMGKNTVIYARKCKKKKIASSEAKIFLNKNHIQGSLNSSFNYGLYRDGELVQVMSFSRPRGMLKVQNEAAWELTRFATALGYNVVGGASRLLKCFIEEVNPAEIVSFCDRSFSPDYRETVYMKLGFEFDSVTPPNYFYVIGGQRMNRMHFQKKILVEQGYDSTKTEHDIMFSRGIYRIYDAGNWKFRWKKSL